MRRLALAVAVAAAVAASYGLGHRNSKAQAGGETTRRVLYYVDPMHPSYKSDKPGIAPDCGMPLEPVYADGAGKGSASSPKTQLPAGAVSIDGATQQLLGIRLAPVERSGATRIVRAVGRVTPEDTRVYKVNSGVDGFIRETYSDSVGMAVKKDQKLATYYAPDFLPAASGFLAAVERVPGAAGNDGARTVPFPGAVAKQGVSSIQGYTDRLRNLGMSDAQIKQMADDHQLPETIDVLAPADGFILARSISPGEHFEHDTEFYRIADLSHVWVIAEVYAQEAQYLHPGGSAQVLLRDEGRRLPARIAGSLPESEAGGGTVKLRLEVDNPTMVLRPDMLVDVELPVQIQPAVTVPLDALIDSGEHARVYVERGEGVYEPREVETGWCLGDRVEILHGVQPGERVVAAATFLIDSESRLKSPTPERAPTSVNPTGTPEHAAAARPVRDPSCGMAVDPAKALASGNTFVYRGTTYYFCSKQCKEAFQNASARSVNKRHGDVND